jgi:hypothetical protein
MIMYKWNDFIYMCMCVLLILSVKQMLVQDIINIGITYQIITPRNVDIRNVIKRTFQKTA